MLAFLLFSSLLSWERLFFINRRGCSMLGLEQVRWARPKAGDCGCQVNRLVTPNGLCRWASLCLKRLLAAVCSIVLTLSSAEATSQLHVAGEMWNHYPGKLKVLCFQPCPCAFFFSVLTSQKHKCGRSSAARLCPPSGFLIILYWERRQAITFLCSLPFSFFFKAKFINNSVTEHGQKKLRCLVL